MKVLCAPNAFKESLSAVAAAEAMGRGVKLADPQARIDLCPVADGGDGTVEALVFATGGQYHQTKVIGPLGKPVLARWGTLGPSGRSAQNQAASSGAGIAVIEMAQASGMALVPPGQRDPTRTTTFGTGQIIASALAQGVTRIILGIGGSATCDGGIGCAQALGVAFYDSAGRRLEKPLTGSDLQSIARVDLQTRDPRLQSVKLTVACDVTNPFFGPQGAACVYAPQKGATPAQVQQLDAGLAHLAKVIRRDLGFDLTDTQGALPGYLPGALPGVLPGAGEPSRLAPHGNAGPARSLPGAGVLPGAGAAGGLGGGAVAFLGARLEPGIDLVLDVVDFDARVRGCDICLTGEGRLDGQTLSGKACLGVARAAGRHGVKTIALVGSLGPGADSLLSHGLYAFASINPGLPLAQSMERAGELLEKATANLCAQGLKLPGPDNLAKP